MNSNENSTLSWLDQVQQFTTGAKVSGTEVTQDAAAVGAALGAIAGGLEKAPSLGALLNVNRDREAARKQAELDAKAQKEAAALAAKTAKVRGFFDAAWAQFTTAILAGEVPKPMYLGKRGSFYEEGSILETFRWSLPWGKSWWSEEGAGIWKSESPFQAIWIEFLVKCVENGLEPEWVYEHDGMGMESWWALRVDVAPSAANAAQSPVTVDAALGNLSEAIGRILRENNREDASGARRAISSRLAQSDFQTAAAWMGCTVDQARALVEGSNSVRGA